MHKAPKCDGIPNCMFQFCFMGFNVFKWQHLISRPHFSSPQVHLFTHNLTTNQQICQRPDSRANICLLSTGERLAPLYFGRHVGGSYPSKTKTGPGFVSFHLCVHADTNSCFELPSRCSALLFHPCSVQPGESRVLYIQGADPAGGVCLPTARQVARR